MNTNKVKKIIDDLMTETPFNFIHPLVNAEDYKKELYIAMLCLVCDMDGNIGDAEKFYINKLMKTMDCKAKFTDLVKLGLNLSKENIKEFLKIFGKAPLSYYFTLDALIVSAIDLKIIDKELQLIAELTELLGIDKNDLEEIAKFASIIIAMDNKELDNFLLKNDNKFEFDYLVLYFFKNYQKPVKISSYITGDITFTESFTFTKKEITIENAKINIEENVKLKFNNQSKLIIKNCEILQKTKEFIEINNNPNVIIEDSSFTNKLTNSTLVLTNCENVLINNCIFSESMLFGYYKRLFFSHEVYIGGKPTIKLNTCNGNISNCKFVDCKEVNNLIDIKGKSINYKVVESFGKSYLEYVTSSAILLSDSNIKTKNVKYSNCGKTNKKDTIDVQDYESN